MHVELFAHQVAQKRDILAYYGYPVLREAPEEGLAGMLVSATGTGKTLTTAVSLLELLPVGRFLVMVPTVDLLVQTAQAWRLAGHRARMIAVCDLPGGDTVLDELDVSATTNPIQLAMWAGTGRVVVLATYASLVERNHPTRPGKKIPGPIEHAMSGSPLMYGQQLAPFDMAVVDEAHRSAGDLARPWAAIHDRRRIDAARRLYLTATPRVLAAPTPGQEGAVIANMVDDPNGTFGSIIGRRLDLGEAIERGILAGFEIDVLEIRDPTPPGSDASPEEIRGRRLGLLQTALLEHSAERDLHTTMLFHQRIEEARVFADTLHATATELYETEVKESDVQRARRTLPAPGEHEDYELEDYELEPYRHVPPNRVWTGWLCGDHLIAHRRDTLNQFANGMDADNRRVHRAFLSSVRVVGEGTDIRGARGVESVCFADPRGSQIEVTQNIGRALRPHLDGREKVARIIVPVFLTPGQEPDDMLASSAFDPLVGVLQALRGYDEALVEQLASRSLSARPADLRRRPHIRSATSAAAADNDPGRTEPESDGDGVQPTDEAARERESALLQFATPRDAATVAAFLRTRVYRPESLAWLEGLNAFRRWRAGLALQGRVSVPYDTEVNVGPGRFPLGAWMTKQLSLARANFLSPWRRDELEAAGVVWDPRDAAWERKIAVLRDYHAAHGHLAPRQTTVWQGQAVGQLIRNLRKPAGLGKDPERAVARAAQLSAIDADWNCPWPLDWQRPYAVLRDLVRDEGGLPAIAPGVVHDGDDLGRWLQRQTLDFTILTSEQQERLGRLGIRPAVRPTAVEPVGRQAGGGMTASFTRGLTALRQYADREGHTTVPRSHVERLPDGTPVGLGIFLSNAKSRRAKLSAAQLAALAHLGITWAV